MLIFLLTFLTFNSSTVNASTIDWEGVIWNKDLSSSSKVSNVQKFQGREDLLKVQGYANYHKRLDKGVSVDNSDNLLEISIDFYGESVHSWSWAPALWVNWPNSGISAWIRKQASSYGQWGMTGKSSVQQYGIMPQYTWFTFKIVAERVDYDSVELSIKFRDVTNNGSWQRLMYGWFSDFMIEDPIVYIGSMINTDYSYKGLYETYYYDDFTVNGSPYGPDLSVLSISKINNGKEGNLGTEIKVKVKNRGGTGTYHKFQYYISKLDGSPNTCVNDVIDPWKGWVMDDNSRYIGSYETKEFTVRLPHEFVETYPSQTFQSNFEGVYAMVIGCYQLEDVGIAWYAGEWKYNSYHTETLGYGPRFQIEDSSSTGYDVVFVGVAEEDDYITNIEGYSGSTEFLLYDAFSKPTTVKYGDVYSDSSFKEIYNYGFEEMMKVDFRFYIIEDWWTAPDSDVGTDYCESVATFASKKLGLSTQFDGTPEGAYTSNHGFEILIGLVEDRIGGDLDGKPLGMYCGGGVDNGVFWAGLLDGGTFLGKSDLYYAESVLVHEMGHRFQARYGYKHAIDDGGNYDIYHHQFSEFIMGGASIHYIKSNPDYPMYFPWLAISYNSMYNPFITDIYDHLDNGDFGPSLDPWDTDPIWPSSTTNDLFHIYHGYYGLALYYQSGSTYYNSHIEQKVFYYVDDIESITLFVLASVPVYYQITFGDGSSHVDYFYADPSNYRREEIILDSKYSGKNITKIKFYTLLDSSDITALDAISFNYLGNWVFNP